MGATAVFEMAADTPPVSQSCMNFCMLDFFAFGLATATSPMVNIGGGSCVGVNNDSVVDRVYLQANSSQVVIAKLRNSRPKARADENSESIFVRRAIGRATCLQETIPT